MVRDMHTENGEEKDKINKVYFINENVTVICFVEIKRKHHI